MNNQKEVNTPIKKEDTGDDANLLQSPTLVGSPVQVAALDAVGKKSPVVATRTRKRAPVVKKAPAAAAKKPVKKRRKERQPWTALEDAGLKRLVQNHDFNDPDRNNHWHRIATGLKSGRNGKQCRDRYQNHLRPDIKKGQWTKDEENMIREMHQAFGTKWSCMAKLMKNRTDNDIKNKWYSMMRKENKAQEKLKKMPPKAHPGKPAPEMEMPDAAIGNETNYCDNMTDEELSQLATGTGTPKANDAFYLPTYTLGFQGWSTMPTMPVHHMGGYYSPQPNINGQGPFALLSSAAASRPMIPCNGKIAGKVLDPYPMTMETKAHPNAEGVEANMAGSSRVDNLGVPTVASFRGKGSAFMAPRSHGSEGEAKIAGANVADQHANQKMPARSGPSHGLGDLQKEAQESTHQAFVAQGWGVTPVRMATTEYSGNGTMRNYTSV